VVVDVSGVVVVVAVNMHAMLKTSLSKELLHALNKYLSHQKVFVETFLHFDCHCVLVVSCLLLLLGLVVVVVVC